MVLSFHATSLMKEEAQMSLRDRESSQFKSGKILHKCSTNCTWKGLQLGNDLQGHSRSITLVSFDKPFPISLPLKECLYVVPFSRVLTGFDNGRYRWGGRFINSAPAKLRQPLKRKPPSLHPLRRVLRFKSQGGILYQHGKRTTLTQYVILN